MVAVVAMVVAVVAMAVAVVMAAVVAVGVVIVFIEGPILAPLPPWCKRLWW